MQPTQSLRAARLGLRGVPALGQRLMKSDQQPVEPPVLEAVLDAAQRLVCRRDLACRDEMLRSGDYRTGRVNIPRVGRRRREVALGNAAVQQRDRGRLAGGSSEHIRTIGRVQAKALSLAIPGDELLAY